MTDIGQTFSGVELEEQTNTQTQDEAQKVMQTIDNKIVRFLRPYSWAFSDEGPVGKAIGFF